MKSDRLLWWGYQHKSGTYQTKRFFSDLDLQESVDSPFTVATVGPFLATDRADAIRKTKEMTKIVLERGFCKDNVHNYELIKGSGQYSGIPYWKCKNCPKTIQSS